MRIRIKLLNLLLLTTFLLVPCRLLGSEDLLEQGLSHLESKRYDEAEKAFSKVLASNPNDAEALCNRGIVWFFKSDYDQAAADFTKALEIDPRYTLAYCNRGILWIEKTDYDRAIEDFSKALKINPRYAEAYFSRGVAWAFKGIHDRAITDFTRALEINAKDAAAYTNRGILWARKADCDRAIADFTKAMELNSRRPEAIAQLSWVLATCPDSRYRNGSKALKLAQKAVRLAPKGRFKATLAAAYAESGQFEEAITNQREVIASLNKGDPEDLLEYKRQLASYEAHRPWRSAISIRKEPDFPVESLNQRKSATTQEAYEAAFLDENGKKLSGETREQIAVPIPTKSFFAVQTGAFLIQKNAEQWRDFLKKKGYATYTLSKSDSRGRAWNYVFIMGEYATHEQAEKAAVAFSTKEKKPSFVVITEAP